MNLVTLSILLYAGILLGGCAALLDSFLTVGQMHRKGFAKGLPWIWHGGMIGDLVFVNPICIIGTSRYGDTWQIRDWVIVGTICFVISVVLHKHYDKGELPEAHTYGGKRTIAGWFHLFYMGFALTIVCLLYFRSEASSLFLVWTSILLTIHMFFGTHCHLKIWNPEWFGISWKRSDLLIPSSVAFITTCVTIASTYL